MEFLSGFHHLTVFSETLLDSSPLIVVFPPLGFEILAGVCL